MFISRVCNFCMESRKKTAIATLKKGQSNGNGQVKYIVTDLVHTYDPRPNIGHVDLGVIHVTIQLIDQYIAYFEQGLEFLI